MGEMPVYQCQIWQDITAVSEALLEDDDSDVGWEILPLPQQSIKERKKYVREKDLGVSRLVFLTNNMKEIQQHHRKIE